MTPIGSTCTRKHTDRTLICNAILYHFQITLTCGRFNRQFIPITLFLLPRPLEQLEFIRFSNSQAEICFIFQPTRPQRLTLPRKLQSRYRRHLFNPKLLFQIIRARRSLHQLSRLRIHLVQEFHIRRIQPRKNVSETNIIVIHDQIPRHDAFVGVVSCRLMMNQSLLLLLYTTTRKKCDFLFFFLIFFSVSFRHFFFLKRDSLRFLLARLKRGGDPLLKRETNEQHKITTTETPVLLSVCFSLFPRKALLLKRLLLFCRF